MLYISKHLTVVLGARFRSTNAYPSVDVLFLGSKLLNSTGKLQSYANRGVEVQQSMAPVNFSMSRNGRGPVWGTRRLENGNVHFPLGNSKLYW